MHEPYDDYDDYNEENYDYSQDYDQNQSDWSKFYFKFDVSNSPVSDWFQKMINEWIKSIPPKKIDWNIKEFFPSVSLPVNNWSHNTESGFNSPLYLGVNYYNQPIWKSKYFVLDKMKNNYINHLTSHAVYFLKQPSHYKGLFDILN